MKLRPLALAAAVAALSAAGAAHADQPGADWLTADQVIQKLMAQGYTNISSLEADNGRWEAKAVLNGARQKIYLEPRTGQVLGHKPTK
ncbi:MAG TPA: PepSY domain-containing protein [Xanthobacteraceae bacterium]|nr:PepSY domain-containing protein [Xanthobacteraceae bacterium]